MKGHGLVGALLVYSGSNMAFTITEYDSSDDSYLVEPANGQNKKWYFREAVEEGIASRSVWLACPVWSMNGTMDTWGGMLATPLQTETWSLSC